jgi:hypothetical protein
MTFRSLSLGTWIVGLTLAVSGHAELIETCTINQDLKLTEATQILCIGNLQVADNLRLLTQGFSLTIITSGNVDFGAGFTIAASDNARVEPAPIEIVATTASGYLRIDNRGLNDSNAPGTVHIEYVSTNAYDQDIYVNSLTPVELILNGFYVTAVGSNYKMGERIRN